MVRRVDKGPLTRSEFSLTPPLRFSLFFVFLLPLAPASKSVWLPLLRSCGPKRNAADPPQECKLRRPSSRRPLHSPHDATWCLSRRRRLRQGSVFRVQRRMVVSSSSDGSRQPSRTLPTLVRKPHRRQHPRSSPRVRPHRHQRSRQRPLLCRYRRQHQPLRLRLRARPRPRSNHPLPGPRRSSAPSLRLLQTTSTAWPLRCCERSCKHAMPSTPAMPRAPRRQRRSSEHCHCACMRSVARACSR